MDSKDYGDMVRALVKPPEEILATLTPEKVDAWHMATGVAGEAGEVSEVIKKHIVYGKELDRTKLVKEMGDLEFYLEGLRQRYEITREEVLQMNFEKLEERYKGQYSNDSAIARVDVKEEVVGTTWLPNFGECPVEDDIVVDIMFKNGSNSVRNLAGYWDWGFTGSGYDIIAWRFSK